MYKNYMRKVCEEQENLDIIEEEVTDIIVEKGKVIGVKTAEGKEYRVKSVVVTTGTFLNGVIYIGHKTMKGGRAGEPPSEGLSLFYKRHGFPIMRFKTGTPARLDKRSFPSGRNRLEATGLKKERNRLYAG